MHQLNQHRISPTPPIEVSVPALSRPIFVQLAVEYRENILHRPAGINVKQKMQLGRQHDTCKLCAPVGTRQGSSKYGLILLKPMLWNVFLLLNPAQAVEVELKELAGGVVDGSAKPVDISRYLLLFFVLDVRPKLIGNTFCTGN